MEEELVSLSVYSLSDINPEPWEASQGSVGRKGGGQYVQFHKPAQLRAYQEAIKENFPKQNPHARLHDDGVQFTFYFWRQVAPYEAFTDKGTKKGRANYADATNLLKATEDALQKILFTNDRTNTRVTSSIIEQGPDVTPFILVMVEPLNAEEQTQAKAWKEVLAQTHAPSEEDPTHNRSGVVVEEFF